MISSGVSTFIELGPGKVLTGLVRRMHPEAKTANINNVSSILAMAS
jgi:[acyl-carrier-protein] S-malonyltransferase